MGNIIRFNGMSKIDAIKEANFKKNNINGKLISLCKEGNFLMNLGKPIFLYLLWIKLMFLFFIILSITHIPTTYIYYNSNNYLNNTMNNTINIWTKFSIANWAINSNDLMINIILGCLELINLFLMIYLIRIIAYIIQKYNIKINEKIITARNYTIEVKNIPENIDYYYLDKLKKIFQHYGPIHRISLAISSSDFNKHIENLTYYLEHCDKINRRANIINKFLYYIEKIKLWWYMRQGKKEYLFCKNDLSNKINKCSGYAYITFEYEFSKNNCLNNFNKKFFCKKIKITNKPLLVREIGEASDIIWDNYQIKPISRIFRKFIVFIIITIAIIISILISALLEDIFSNTWINNSISNIIIDINGNNIYFYSNLDILDSVTFFTSILLSIILFIIQMFLSFFIYYITIFERKKYKSRFRVSLMNKASIGSFLCDLMAIISIIQPYAPKIYCIMLNTIMYWFGEEYKCFPYIFIENSNFYFTLFNICIWAGLDIIIKDILLLPYHTLIKWYNIYISLNQKDLCYAYEPPDYSMEYRYSSVLRVLMLCISFSGLYPITLWFCIFIMFCIYFVDKFNLLKLVKKFDYEEDLCTMNAIKLINLSIVFRYILMFIFYPLRFILTDNFISNPYMIIMTISLLISIFQYLLPLPILKKNFENNLPISNIIGIKHYIPPVTSEDIIYSYNNDSSNPIKVENTIQNILKDFNLFIN